MQCAIFLLGGACALSAKAGQWGWAVVYVVLALVCYRLMLVEVKFEVEDEE